MSALPRPDASEYNEYYAKYIGLVPDGGIVTTMKDQLSTTLAMLEGLSEEQETTPYEEGKWSLREVVGHLVDTERVFAYRALAMARQDDTDLAGLDQDLWQGNSNAASRSLDDLTKEWVAVRRSNVHLFATFDAATGARTGVASGMPFTVRTFAWIIAGHELWHRALIERDYLGGGD